MLGYLLLVLRAIYGFRLVSDAHWLGVKAGHGNPRVQKLLDFHNSKVDMVIVTNDNHAKFIESLGGHAAVCEDPLPVLPAPSLPAEALPEKSVFLVCSFDIDEPYEAVFQAFKALKDDGYVLYVSGNYRRARVDPARFPWIRFLGFLPESEYYAYLWSCSVILDLTTLEDCLVCGGYEALAAGKALVLSNTAAIQAYFGAGALTTPNTEAAIGKSVVAAYEKKAELERKAGQWADDSVVKMDQRILHLKAMLSTLASEKNFQRAR
ncbi:MAG TPA: hypothetical protein VHB46_16395 [Burkholderiales bacterium]|nr:hypothetical protein [Burkholderiales bacterium]